MTSSLNRIVLATVIGLSATSAFAASSRVHHPREAQTTSDYRAISPYSALQDNQARPVETPAEKNMYDRTRLLSGY